MVINLHNKDCMLALKEFKDNQFDLAIVDPPYMNNNKGLKNIQHLPNRKCSNFNLDTLIRPTSHYFDELFRVSKNQII